MGFGSMAFGGMLNAGLASSALGTESSNPMLPKPAQFPSKVKHVIHLFMNGGPSHVDTFDPKPELQRRGGQTISDGNLKTERPTGALYPSPFRFRRYGKAALKSASCFRTSRSMWMTWPLFAPCTPTCPIMNRRCC
jgi:hypothetical protein